MLLSQASGGLFLDPGLGKTSTILATFKVLKQQGLVRRMLIVAPLRPVYKVWPDEILKWHDFSSLTFSILHGKGKEQRVNDDADIHIINPEGLKWLLTGKKSLPYDVLCIDESTKFKDSTTARFKLLKPLIPLFKRRWILTGTPSPNGLMDLFGQIYILDLGRSLGRFITHYRREFFRQGYTEYSWVPQDDAFPRIVDRISPLVLQLSAEDYLQMPELRSIPIEVKLPPSVMEMYKSVEDEFIADWQNGKIVAANAAVAGGKLRQIANGAIYREDHTWVHVHDEKLEALEDLLEELNGHSILLLYEFKHDLERILARVGDVPNLSGSSMVESSRIIDGFNRGSIPLVFGHPASMGHGLNLQGSCHNIIWFGPQWDLELTDQAIARVYRQGQTSRHVNVYYIVAKDTRDEDVMLTLNDKDREQQNLLKALSSHRQINFQGV